MLVLYLMRGTPFLFRSKLPWALGPGAIRCAVAGYSGGPFLVLLAQGLNNPGACEPEAGSSEWDGWVGAGWPWMRRYLAHGNGQRADCGGFLPEALGGPGPRLRVHHGPI